MPEGAEVKRCSEVVSDSLNLKVLSEVKLISGKLHRLGVKNLDKLTLPTKINSISARGKSIFIELDGDYSLVSTLGMSGWWYPPSSSIKKEDLDEAYYSHVINTIEKAEKHTRLQLVTEDGSSVNYVDPRNFGNFYVLDQKEFVKRRDSFGPDFLNDGDLDVNVLASKLHQQFQSIKNIPIGEALLNQTLLAGLGNIYRAETMYLARISPHRLVRSLGKEDTKKILEAAYFVLCVAYNSRGRMIYPATGMSFFMFMPMSAQDIDRHLVYGCNIDIFGNSTRKETIGGRTCWWTPAIQI
jgi:formamidopyrimidine-DNA glycosylase